MSRRRFPASPSRVVAIWPLESRNCRTYLHVEARQGTEKEDRFLAIRRFAQVPGDEFPTHVKGMSIDLNEVDELIDALREAAALAVTGGGR